MYVYRERTMKVIAFDIGIKNLAFCVLEDTSKLIALANCNLLEPVEPHTCAKCKSKASFTVDRAVYCKRHVPKTHQVLKELSHNKLPPNKTLKELVKLHGCELLGSTNNKCIESLSKKFAIHFEQPSQPNASKVSLEIIHDALLSFARDNWPIFKGCTHVLLENQPAFKNPHMKSVQVLLFATLRAIYLQHEETPEYHFVHAKKKVANAQKGDEGYADRKAKSEDRVKELFDSNNIVNPDLYQVFQHSKKKSDMADAVCMAVDCFINTM